MADDRDREKAKALAVTEVKQPRALLLTWDVAEQTVKNASAIRARRTVRASPRRGPR